MSDLILFLLDESGSMLSQADEMVDAINGLIASQRSLTPDEDPTIELIKFNHGVKEPIIGNLKTFHLNHEDYNPSSGTALFDAIGEIVSRHKDKKNVIAVIVTDGADTSSMEHKLSDVKDMINRKTNIDGWKFLYLSENVESMTQGETMGLSSVGGTCKSVSSTMGSQEFSRELHLSRSQKY